MITHVRSEVDVPLRLYAKRCGERGEVAESGREPTPGAHDPLDGATKGNRQGHGAITHGPRSPGGSSAHIDDGHLLVEGDVEFVSIERNRRPDPERVLRDDFFLILEKMGTLLV